jgi:protein-tyrosine kinase
MKGKTMSKIFEALENAEKERVRKSPAPFLEPKAEKKTELVVGPKEEKKTAPILGPREEKLGRPGESAQEQRATELRKGFTPAPEPKEEKKTLPVLEPKSERMERPAPTAAPEPREVKKTPSVLGSKEENKTAPVPEPKGVRVERQRIVPPPKMVRAPVRPNRMQSDHPLVSISQPGSLGAEQFRRLRTHVLKLNVSDPPKTIMVTSATEGEGKTFVAANLAAGIAHDLHFHALLVDCDLHNPSLSHWFGVQNGHGLSDYLVGRGQLPELLIKTEMEKLSLLTGGSAQVKPAELIGSRKMEALIQELKSRYNDRYIILDSTPLLATTEPEVLARLVDGILIVVRAGVTPRETVKQAIASLDPKKIMGFVLNDVKFKSSGLSSRYFGSDGYYTRYGYGKRGAEPRNPSRGISPFKKKSG